MQDSTSPLPVDIEQITPVWLNAALRSMAPSITLKDAEILDISHGTCTIIRIRLDLDEAGKAAGIPERVILKGGFEPHSRGLDWMHEHEVRAYADVQPILPLRSPTCFFAEYDAERGQGIVILDDLVARGVEFCHAQCPLTPDQVAARLTVIARHHARTWGRHDFEPSGRFDWATGLIEGLYRFGGERLTPAVWQSFVDSPRGAAVSVRFHGLDWMEQALAKMLVLSREQPKVLLHGDTHLGNLYIDIDGEPGFFDPQPHHGPAMFEVAYHLTCALDLADRRVHERNLVAHYREELVRNGISPPSLDEMMRQFGCFLAAGYCIFLINEPVFQPEAINTAYTARFGAAMLDHDTIGLLEAIG